MLDHSEHSADGICQRWQACGGHTGPLEILGDPERGKGVSITHPVDSQYREGQREKPCGWEAGPLAVGDPEGSPSESPDGSRARATPGDTQVAVSRYLPPCRHVPPHSQSGVRPSGHTGHAESEGGWRCRLGTSRRHVDVQRFLTALGWTEKCSVRGSLCLSKHRKRTASWRYGADPDPLPGAWVKSSRPYGRVSVWLRPAMTGRRGPGVWRSRTG